MIYVRDHDCYDYLKKKFDFKNLKESRDLAFLDIPYQNDASQQERVKSEFGIKTDYITIVPSGARRQYTSDTENYINEYIKIIHYIVDVLKYDVLLLAHVIHVSDSSCQGYLHRECYTKNEKIYKIVFETCFKAKKMVSAYEMNGIFDYTIKWRDKRNE